MINMNALSQGEMAIADDELRDDPNAAPTDPMRRMTIVGNRMPPVLFEGWCFKKRASAAANRFTATCAAMPSLKNRLGWSRRYVRVYPGKLEWYKSDDLDCLATPLGYAPLVVLDQFSVRGIGQLVFDQSGDSQLTWRPICTVATLVDSSSPLDHRKTLRVSFGESGEVKYRVGIGAHHAHYSFAPESVEDVKALSDALAAAVHATKYWSADVSRAAADAGLAGYIPVNAALERIASTTSPRGADQIGIGSCGAPALNRQMSDRL